MTITNEDELDGMREIGRIVAVTLQQMARVMERGMTTAELDAVGRRWLEREGAQSAPQTAYGFPGATCISVAPAVAHGVPDGTPIGDGDLVNIDVSASKDGFFADTGASFAFGAAPPRTARLCRDGRRAMWEGLRQVRSGNRLGAIGDAVGRFAAAGGYSLLRNLASHGIGHALHEAPGEIATWPTGDRRRIADGMVLTVEPFLSLGGRRAVECGDGWTLFTDPPALAVQYEHTAVATRRGPLVLTLAA